KCGKVDDGGVGILLIRHHKDREIPGLGDGAVQLGKGLALGSAKNHGLAIPGDQNSPTFKLGTPSCEIPAIADIKLIIINEGEVETMFLQKLADFREPCLAVSFAEVTHGIC